MQAIQKKRTGIRGLDEITNGGLPAGRPTLLCGGPGCGKTLLSLQFLVNGATLFGEKAVFFAFEERVKELEQNASSLGVDLAKLAKARKLVVDHIHIDRHEIKETGEYDLDGLFIRLNFAIDSLGAKRVVLDTIENLFAGLKDEAVVRTELRRLFHWLKDKGVTAIITAERGEAGLTRHGLEEYVSDCVILLDNRVIDQITTRRLRIIKYRGSSHGTNEYPFLIEDDGISVLPITSMRLDKKVSSSVLSSGIPSLDSMLGKKGFFRGSSILVSGTSGTGKTSIAAHFIQAACARGEKAVFFAFEESARQIIRNMRSIGINLEPFLKKGLLEFVSSHPTEAGLEMHLVKIHKKVHAFRPDVVVIDPISNMINIGMGREIRSLMMRIIDLLSSEGITVMCTALTMATGDHAIDEGISSMMDTWIQVRDLESNGERNKGLYILKSRGMSHSNQVREFIISNKGVQLIDIFLGPSGVLTGSARAEAQKNRKNHPDSDSDDRQKSARIRQSGKIFS